MTTGYVLGLDAGNTKTIALIARADGQVVGSGRAGCGDLYNNPTPDHAFDTMLAATYAALAQAGRQLGDLGAVCGSLAGAVEVLHDEVITLAVNQLARSESVCRRREQVAASQRGPT